MDLVIQVTSPAPPKSAWHNPDPKSRGEWTEVYELTTNWFCSSHDFNKADNLVIQYNEAIIHLNGESLRYLGPSLRSAASLLHKAFRKLSELRDGEAGESTPGIMVYSDSDQYQFPEPYYLLVPAATVSPNPPTSGTLFCSPVENAQEYYVPASRLSQGIIWYLQERSQ